MSPVTLAHQRVKKFGSLVIVFKESTFQLLAKEHFLCDTTKRLMSSSKCRSVEVINNPARPGSNHKDVNYISYK